jgi:alanyl-tRNA synthetase
MVQFKNLFTGLETRDFKLAASSQKCVRAGGKHNDLENVGYTARHHTFFEMLGNFSFGDYFKERAIELAWKLITEEFQIDQSRLLVTVYHDDEEAFQFWKKIAGLPENRIIRIATTDNFWAMGEVGPCGPCSEIFFDHGDHIPGGPPGSSDEDGDRFIEIWNLVFMQYEQLSSEKRENLPQPSIDTGMGLERISALLQGSHDNYKTDTFRFLIEASAEFANVEPYGRHNVSNRVIADHLRASSFLIADGILPSNEGRGYVLRRILRRGMRHAHLMGCKDPLMYQLVPSLIAQMGLAYPELTRVEALITETLELEEKRFKETLDRGLKLLTEETNKLAEKEPLPGQIAFRLYDTYGFPLDLTQDVLRSQGRSVDTSGFDASMERQQEDARRAWSGSGDKTDETVWFDIKQTFGGTEFLGYSSEYAEGTVLAIVKDGVRVETAIPGDEVSVVVNQTPFYAESGGQMGDSGILSGDKGGVLTVRDTKKMVDDLHVHVGTLSENSMSLNEVVELRVNPDRRFGIKRHHSATHLLHAALRNKLGNHVTQKGSLVSPHRLRFDISHPKPVSPEEISEVMGQVNFQIQKNTKVLTRLMTPDEAIKIGAMALFGEKYGEEVRVVTMGNIDETPYSLELCGGTHVERTGDIGSFFIVSESAVAAGVRRIEAISGQAVLAHMTETDAQLKEASGLLNVSPDQVPDRITALLAERKKLENELSAVRRKLATGESGANESHNDIKFIAGVSFVGRVLEGIPARDLKSFVDDLKTQIGSGVIAICATDEGKASLVVGVTGDLLSRFDAVALVRVGSIVLGGKGGGGRLDMAQAGGPETGKAGEAIAAIEMALSD